MKRSLFPSLLAVLAIAVGANTAFADTVIFNSYVPGSSSYPVNWNSTNPVLYSSSLTGPQSGSTTAGVFNITLNGVDMQSFCVDLTHTIPTMGTLDTSYSLINPLLSGLNQTQITSLERLLTSYGSLINTSYDNAAAFQMAVWEITNEPTGIYNLGSGNFTETGNLQASALASAWVSNLGTQDNYNIQILQSSTGKQAQMVWTVVPEPTSATLIGAFGIACLLRRRRLTA